MRAIANGWSHAISLYRHAALFINPPNSHMKALLTAKTCFLMSTLLVTYCHRAHAQVRPTRHGLWMDVGLGHGSLHVSGDTLRSRSQDGIDFIGTLGGRSAPGSGPESASTSGRVSGVLVSKIGSPA